MSTPEAVIEIGATGVRLLVAEITSDRKRNTLDRSELPVSIGKDVFNDGVISRETLIQLLKILKRFTEQLKGWGITAEHTTVIATSSFREAKNRYPVLDRIFTSTGFRVNVIDGIEENRLTYIAVNECLKDAPLEKKEDTVILEISGGSTEMMLIKKGKMAGAHSLKLGSARFEKMHISSRSFEDMNRYVSEFIQNTKGSLESELNLSDVKHFIAVGSVLSVAALRIGKPISTFLWQISRKDFEKFTDEIQKYSIDELMASFKISFSDAQSMQVSLLMYKMFVSLTKVKFIIVPETNIREGLIIDRASDSNSELKNEFNDQVLASASNLLRKYYGDQEHAEYVRSMSLKLFDAMESVVFLDERSRLLLQVAAILHDIGIFIRLDQHNLHGEYIIKNSEIFGLSKTENTIISLIAKYHRGKKSPQDSEQFQNLPRTERMIILKLTAILRVADALDRGHGQKLSDISFNLSNDALTIKTKNHQNISLERLAILQKGDFFESVFGLKIILI